MDFRSNRNQVSINITRVLDPIARTVTLINHDDQGVITMDADFAGVTQRYWTSSISSRQVSEDELGAGTCRKTIEGLDCYLLMMDSSREYEVWVSHRLGYAVREQVKDQDGLRIWMLTEVKLGDVEPNLFSANTDNFRAIA
jgi:hypothetical protein